jgi:hypothetical protein
MLLNIEGLHLARNLQNKKKKLLNCMGRKLNNHVEMINEVVNKIVKKTNKLRTEKSISKLKTINL